VTKPQTPSPDLTRCVFRLWNQPRQLALPTETPNRQHDYTRLPTGTPEVRRDQRHGPTAGPGMDGGGRGGHSPCLSRKPRSQPASPPAARRSNTTRARANPTQRPPRGRPRKFHRPGQRLRPGPTSSPRPDRHRGRRPLRRGGARWMNGGQPLRTRLPRPESLCWRCGVPGHSRGDCRAPSVLFCSRCGTMGLMSRECPCPRPPAAPFPRAAGLPCWSTPNPQQPRSERRAHCAAAAGANVATTAVKPGHHRRQETSCSCSKTSLDHLYF
jgi:hypothetical protein